jgi:NRAMP (natural resistance-associated macrophage protein)-like metal ion transporter
VDAATSQAARGEGKAPMFTALKKFLRILGPGIITGAADDDPSGIATYSRTGVQFGYGQLWTALFLLPLLAGVQEACSRIGVVTGKGIAAVVREHYSKPVLYIVVLLVLIANTINIGADIGAMAAAADLLFPLPLAVFALLFTVIILTFEIFLPYKAYARVLKWLTLALLAYPLTVFIVAEPWPTILRATFLPHLEFTFPFLFVITGVLGTTISPYMFFWQASEETEEEREAHLLGKDGRPRINWGFIRNMRIDTIAGMFSSQVVTWAIIVVAATVLHGNGVTNIQTAADAARALLPLVHTFPNSGYIAQALFATGIIGLGLLLNFIGINPIKALVYAAVLNGVVAVPLIFIIALIARNKTIMGPYRSGWVSNLLVWLTFLGMGAAAVAMFATLGH